MSLGLLTNLSLKLNFFCAWQWLQLSSDIISELFCLSFISLSETEANPEQQTAIQHIVACSAKPAPYLVFGPPGTGIINACMCECPLVLKYENLYSKQFIFICVGQAKQ